VEDGGAKKLPLLRVAVLEDVPFFFMARNRGGSPSWAWWKREGRARFEYSGVAWPELASTQAVRFRRFNTKGPWGHDGARFAALRRGTWGFRRGTLASNFLLRFTLASNGCFAGM
jgi:hypothetical protein